MSDENDIVQAFDRFFQQADYQGIAYRRKQHRFSSQFVDVLVDTPAKPNLAIEAKSFKTSSSNKLYFSQHFSSDTDDKLEHTHQVHRVEEFAAKSGRVPLLSVEVRRGTGVPKELYLLPWSLIVKEYQDGTKGFNRDYFQRNGKLIKREGGDYHIQSYPAEFK